MSVWWFIGQMLWFVWSIVFWLISTLFWLSLWVLLPVIVFMFVAVRIAEYLLGKERVRQWAKGHSLKFGAVAWQRTHRALFALGILPVRVLSWWALYTVWHSAINLLWTPGWTPWQRAWDRRWRKKGSQVSSSGR